MFRIENGSRACAGFRLGSGAAMALRLAYQHLVPARPVRRRILLCHGITSSHEAYLPPAAQGRCADAGWGNGCIGPGLALDPEQGDEILCINTLGSWFGSSHADAERRTPFPALDMADMAAAQWRLIDALGIASFDQVIGYSFGGYLALEMACQQGARMGALLHLASAFRGRADPQGVAAIEALMRLAPPARRQATLDWRLDLLQRYGYARWLRDRHGAGAESWLRQEAAAWADSVSLPALLTLRAAAAGFDCRAARLPLPVTAIRWDGDSLFPAWQAEEMPPCRALNLASPYGHYAPLAQPEDWASYLNPA